MNAALDEAQQLYRAGDRDRVSFQLLVETIQRWAEPSVS
jgi:hypothetical protein